MRTTLKDVALLCKGYYDRKKYSSAYDALKQYYREYYVENIEEELLSKNFIVKVVLQQAVQELVDEYPDRTRKLVLDLLKNDPFLIFENNGTEDNSLYYETLFTKITCFFHCLIMRGDGFKEIDTSDYFDNSSGCKECHMDIIH